MQSKKIKLLNKQISNPLNLVPNFEFFESNGIKVKLDTKKSCKLNEETKKWCFNLLEINMKEIYDRSKSGWNAEEKEKEMFDPNSYYVIATNKDSDKPIGFCHFRIDNDFENEVIYCYELQIDSNKRKLGLGQFIMLFLEELCEKLELEKVMLTCSKFNTVGQKFFREKMQYELDETDPNEDGNETVDYCILSKQIWEEADESI